MKKSFDFLKKVVGVYASSPWNVFSDHRPLDLAWIIIECFPGQSLIKNICIVPILLVWLNNIFIQISAWKNVFSFQPLSKKCTLSMIPCPLSSSNFSSRMCLQNSPFIRDERNSCDLEKKFHFLKSADIFGRKFW